MSTLKILIAKPGLDGHDRGAKVVAKYLRDSGMEVIYTGLRQTPEKIVNAAIQEDVNAIGLSVLSGAHLQLCKRLFAIFKQKKVDPPAVFVGGVIPEEDIASLTSMGIKGVFLPGHSLADICRKIQKNAL